MSGIAGIHYLDSRPASQETIDSMVQAMSHRGPDGMVTWSSGSVALGQCTMRTHHFTACGGQLGVSPDIRVRVAMDGRIDNRGELLKSLGVAPARWKDVLDDELVRRAYRRWGGSYAEHMVGVFAAAVWDEDRMAFHVSTDHFGVRPLYYYHAENRLFAFASEVKALLRLPEVPATPDKVRIAEHLLVPVQENVERTFYASIKRLTPAHRLVARHGTLNAHRYWSLRDVGTVRMQSNDAYAQQFRQLFSEAVRVRLPSDGNVGAMLSGGLDSSSITCVAAEHLGKKGAQRLHTFSSTFGATEKGQRSDESEYIQAVLAKHPQLQSHVIQGDAESPLKEWPQILPRMDEPITTGNMYIFWRSYQTALQEDIRIVLDGFDGDSTVSHGIGFLYELQKDRRLFRLAYESAALARTMGESIPHVMWSWLKGPVSTLPVASQLLALGRRYRNQQAHLISDATDSKQPAWRQLLSSPMLEEIEDRVDTAKPGKPDSAQAQHIRKLERSQMTRILDLWNGISALAGVEVAYPFYDRRLIEFCVGAPPDQKLHFGWSRYILRNAMSGILPEKVQWRVQKSNLSYGFDAAVVEHDRAQLEALLDTYVDLLEEYVSVPYLREHVPRYIDGALQTGVSGDGVRVFRALSLALWLTYRS